MAAAPDDDARRTLAELEEKLRDLERELLRGYEPGTVDADPFAAAEEEPAPEPTAPEPTALRPDEPEPTAPEPAAPEPAAPEPAAPEPAAFDATAEPAAPEPAAPPAPEPAAPEPAAPEPAAPAPTAFDAAESAAPDTREHAAREPEPEPVARLDHDALELAHGLLAGLRDAVEDMGGTAARVTAEAQAVVDDHGRTLGRMARAAQAAARAEEAAAEAGRLAATVVVEAGPFADARAVSALREALASQPGATDAYVRGVEDGRAVIEVHLAPPSS
jgi:hypothetical protein